MASGPSNSVIRSEKVVLGRYTAFSPLNASQLVTGSQVSRDICAAVFSCTTMSTVSENSTLPPLWS